MQLLMVRIGNAPCTIPVPARRKNEIWKYLNQLECGTTSVRERQREEQAVEVFPNPAKRAFTFRAEGKISVVQIFQISGQLIQNVPIQGTDSEIPMEAYPNGLYFVKVLFEGGFVWLAKVVKG